MDVRYTAVFAAALCLALVAGRAEGGPDRGKPGALKIGDPVPMADVKMKNVDDRRLSIEDVKGEKGTLVIFSCNHCPYVKAWEDRIAALGNTYRKQGVGVIVINSNSSEKVPQDGFEEMVERAEAKGFEFPYVVDATSDVARAFGATRTPEAFLFDGEGKLVYHGAIDDNSGDPEGVESHYMKDALDAVIAGKAIGLKETKAIGCSIKFRPRS